MFDHYDAHGLPVACDETERALASARGLLHDADAELTRLRGELAKAEDDSAWPQWLAIDARRKVAAVRQLHQESDGRCVQCVEYCDCLERGRTRLEDCDHGNVDWPCPTIRALTADEAVDRV